MKIANDAPKGRSILYRKFMESRTLTSRENGRFTIWVRSMLLFCLLTEDVLLAYYILFCDWKDDTYTTHVHAQVCFLSTQPHKILI